jgi:hypothetical protein
LDDLLVERQKVKILEEDLRCERFAHARLKGLKVHQRRLEAAVFSADFTELWPTTTAGYVQKHRALKLVKSALTAACAEWSPEIADGRTSRTGRSSVGRPGTPSLDAPGQGPVQFAASPRTWWSGRGC